MPKHANRNFRNYRNERNNPYALDSVAASINRSAAGLAWRWRTELAVTLASLAGWDWLAHLATAATAGIITALVLAVLGLLPWTRRRFWCVLARHRIQRLCWEARLHTRAGRLPLVLWARPTKVGERVHVLCRAGICAEDFEAHIGELRSACFAREARVTRNLRWSQLVTIDIIRRDTLAARHQVPSPLLATTRQTGQQEPAGTRHQ